MKNSWVVKNGIVEAAVLLMMLFLLGSAHGQAQAQATASAQTDPGVGRISLINGDVSTQRGDSDDWAAATVNQPVVSGDKISTGDDSRAEVQVDYSNIVRLGNRTQANFSTLSRTQIQVQLAQGTINYTIFKDSEAEPEIDTPNVAIHPYKKDGSFRIESLSDDETRIIVRNGQADISTPQGATQLHKGQMITVQGTGDGTQYQISDAPERDDWDSFNSDRDNTIHSADSWHDTNRYYVGSEDLDAYGHWDDDPGYGRVWVPEVGPDWVPYRAGRWVWEPYYGWTWVSYEPWGWAPYHYGRWYLRGAGWAWWPGPVFSVGYYRPIWAPAYVSFFGFGGGISVGVGFGFGHVGWLPIGPCDRFYPWYGRFGGHFNEVHVTNITNITNITNVHNGGFAPLRAGNGFSSLRAMNDPNVRRAFSTVPAERFGTGRGAASAANPAMFRDAHMMTGNLPVVPSRESLAASNRAASPTTVPRGEGQQRFFGHQPAQPQRFEQQQASVQQAIQRDGHFTPIQSGTGMRTDVANRGGVMNNGRGVAATNNPGAGNNQLSPASRGFGNNQGGGAAAGSNNNARGWQRSVNGGSGNVAQSNSPTPANNNASSDRGWRSSTGDHGWGAQPSGGSSGSLGRSNSPAPTNNNNGSGSRGWGSGGGNSNPDRSVSPAPTNNNNGSGSRGWGSGGGSSSGSDRGWGGGSSRNSSGGSGGWGGRSDSSASRPPLDMRQPIMTPRSSGGGGGGGYSSGGYRGGSSSGSSGSYHGGYSGSSGSSGGSRGSSSSGSSGSHDSGRSSSGSGRSR